jgi:hypothetical protein
VTYADNPEILAKVAEITGLRWNNTAAALEDARDRLDDWDIATSGIYAPVNAHRAGQLIEQYPELVDWVEHPCGCTSSPALVFDAVIHLNDMHAPEDGGDWDRDRIADWLDGVLS